MKAMVVLVGIQRVDKEKQAGEGKLAMFLTTSKSKQRCIENTSMLTLTLRFGNKYFENMNPREEVPGAYPDLSTL